MTGTQFHTGQAVLSTRACVSTTKIPLAASTKQITASFARNTFMFECASFSLPLGSYKLAMNLQAQTIEVFSSSPPMKTSSAKESTPFSEIVLYTEFFPIPKKTDVESHPVRA